MIARVHRKLFVREPRFAGFLEPNALAINEARLRHLASLDLPIAGKSVLEVGAGIGLLTGFFEERGCSVTSTDARRENIAENKRRHPQRRVARLNLEQPADVEAFGKFDIVFCYGTLYHLAAPEPALEALSKVSDMILLETCVSPGEGEAAPKIPELLTVNQAYSGTGSRPTREWVLNRLKRFWGNGYISKSQPSHEDFPLDWTKPPATVNVRAIFVGSRTPLANPLLTTETPARHSRA
jgi:SAM-dependent methyltransferase